MNDGENSDLDAERPAAIAPTGDAPHGAVHAGRHRRSPSRTRRASRARRPRRRSRRRSAITTAFMAPALVALIASMSSRPSSSSLSSTPQAKAPWAPPPCRASVTGLVMIFVAAAAFGEARAFCCKSCMTRSFGSGFGRYLWLRLRSWTNARSSRLRREARRR